MSTHFWFGGEESPYRVQHSAAFQDAEMTRTPAETDSYEFGRSATITSTVDGTNTQTLSFETPLVLDEDLKTELFAPGDRVYQNDTYTATSGSISSVVTTVDTVVTLTSDKDLEYFLTGNIVRHESGATGTILSTDVPSRTVTIEGSAPGFTTSGVLTSDVDAHGICASVDIQNNQMVVNSVSGKFVSGKSRHVVGTVRRLPKYQSETSLLTGVTNAAGYEVPQSLEFTSEAYNSSTANRLSKDFASEGNRKTWTVSMWAKFGATDRTPLFSASTPGDLYNYFIIETYASHIEVLDYTSNYNAYVRAEYESEDKASWHHIVCAFDTTNPSETERLRLYVDGARVTNPPTPTYPSLDFEGRVNGTGITHSFGGFVGVNLNSGFESFGGNMAECQFIDGYALNASYFGEFNPFGQWIPKEYANPEDLSAIVGTSGSSQITLATDNNFELLEVGKVVKQNADYQPETSAITGISTVGGWSGTYGKEIDYEDQLSSCMAWVGDRWLWVDGVNVYESFDSTKWAPVSSNLAASGYMVGMGMAYNPTADRIVIIMNSKSQNYQLGGTHLSDSHPANKLYSDDKGRTWTICPIANNANNSKYPYFRSVKWIPEADDGNGRFVYLGAENWGQPTGASEILATSGDGINWDSVVIGMNTIAYGPMDIAYSPRDDEWLISVQVRQGHSTTPSTMIRTTDGKFWETPSAPGWAFTTNTWTTNVGAGLNYTQLHWVPELSTNGAWAVGIQYPSNRIRVIPDLDASGTGKYFDTYPVVSSQDQYSLNQFLYSPDEQTFLITTTGYWSNYTPKIWVTSTTSVYSWDEVSLDLNLTEDDSPQFLNCVNNAFSPQLKAFQFYGSQANTPGRKTLSGGVFRDSTVLTLTDTTDLDVLQIGTTMTQNGPTASGGLISINESTPSITISGDGTGWATTNTAYGENIPSGVGVITAFYPTSNIIDFDLVSGGFVANKGRFAQVQEYGYGQNGSHLTFAASDIGKDVSGASNDWGVYNLTASDVTVDSPSDYGSETGGGGEIRSNYCKLNPLSNPLGSDIYANGDLTVDTSGGANNVTAGTLGVSSGKWYWEVTIESGVGVMIGVANFGDTDIRYDQENGLYYYQANGQVYGGLGRSSATSASYGDVCSPGDVIGVALDMDAGTATFYRNNVSQGVANESSLIGKVIGPAIGNGGAASRVTTNFGQKPFQYNAPSGFKTLNTLNLP